jgi:hypothetical protein
MGRWLSVGHRFPPQAAGQFQNTSGLYHTQSHKKFSRFEEIDFHFFDVVGQL